MFLRRSWRSVVSVLFLTGLAVVHADGADATKPMDLGYQALTKGDSKTALARFDEAIRAEPKNAQGYFGRGQAYWVKGDLDLAIADLNKVIQIEPTWATAYRNRGALYVAKGDYNRAIVDCDEAIRRDPDDSVTYNNRGYAYLRKGVAKEAIRDFDCAIQLDSKAAIAYANRGLAWCMQRVFDRAIPDLDEAIRIEPNNAAAYQLRSGAYLCRGEFEKALADINAAIRINPDWADVYQKRAIVYWHEGNNIRATEDFTRAIRLEPNNAAAYAGRGCCLAWQGQYQQAVADFTKAISLNPKSPCLYEMRGALWISRGEHERGTSDIRKALELNPADLAATFEALAATKAADSAGREHGERQVRQMLHDRPAMAMYGERARPLYDWAVRKFAGEDFGRKIFWDGSLPPSFTSSANWQATEDGPGLVQVAGMSRSGPNKGQERSFEELWRDVVFELYNIENAGSFRHIATEAAAGKLSKEEFVSKLLGCESKAVEKTRAFYIRAFLPWAKEHLTSTVPYAWGLGRRLTTNDDLLGLTAENEPNWRSYACRYDIIVLDKLTDKGEYQKALDLAAKMEKEAETAEERAAIRRYTGHCQLRLNKPLAAVRSFSETISLDPKDANAYLGRAAGYALLNDTNHALSDASEAVRLEPLSSEVYYYRAQIYETLGDREHAKSDLAMAKQLSELLDRGDGREGTRESGTSLPGMPLPSLDEWRTRADQALRGAPPSATQPMSAREKAQTEKR